MKVHDFLDAEFGKAIPYGVYDISENQGWVSAGIDHELSHITRNWRGRPLVSHDVIIKLIANTTAHTGLKILVGLDTGKYPTGIAVTDEELAELNLKRADFHGEWNYKLLPLCKNSDHVILTRFLSGINKTVRRWCANRIGMEETIDWPTQPAGRPSPQRAGSLLSGGGGSRYKTLHRWLHSALKQKAHYILNSGLSFTVLGWLMGLEPTTTGITILDSTN